MSPEATRLAQWLRGFQTGEVFCGDMWGVHAGGKVQALERSRNWISLRPQPGAEWVERTVVEGTVARKKERTCSTQRRLVFWKIFSPLLVDSLGVEPMTGGMTAFPFHRRGSRTQVKTLADWQPEIPAQTPDSALCFLCHLDMKPTNSFSS